MDKNRKTLVSARLIVIKLGSGILSNVDGGLDESQIQRLVRQIALLRKQKRRILIVSSGAISAGMTRLGLHRRPKGISDLQACAAVGQNLLMAGYEKAFRKFRLTVAQVLLTHEDLRHPERRKNARHALMSLLQRGVVPVINENDAVSFAEIKFGDNDQLAAMVHELLGAHVCVILSNVEGFMQMRNGERGMRSKKKGGQMLPTIHKITLEIEKSARGSNSHRSVGGMRSKLIAARRVLATGHPMVIANGRAPSVLVRLFKGEPLGTIFLPS